MTDTHKKKDARGVWIALRVAAFALIPLSLWFCWFIAQALGADHAAFVTLLAQPWNALALSALIGVACFHGALGAHEIWEDYVACPRIRCWAIAITDAAAFGFVATCLGAIALIAL